jgi:CRISP-associated protein Cas1
MHLVLNSYGTGLQVENGMFAVLHSDGKQLLAPGKIKSISLHKGIKLTSDVIMLAVKHEIDVLFLGKGGTPEGRIWSNRYGSISTIRKHQIVFAASVAAVTWIKDIIVQKADNQTAILLSFAAAQLEERNVNKAIAKIDGYKTKILGVEGHSVYEVASTLRGLEGQISKVYFNTVSEALPLQYRFAHRSQHPATDMFNSLLNYAYGILYGKVEGALIKAGIDPYLGILHRDEYNRPTMVYDVIEAFRAWADYTVINLCLQDVILPEYFQVTNGAYWLEGHSKRILIQSFQDYLDETITLHHITRSRGTHLDLYSQRLAQQLLDFNTAPHTASGT